MTTYSLTTLVTFNGGNGDFPEGGLIADSAGDLYGTTTEQGGQLTDGEVFELVKSTGALQVLATFTGANGASPSGSLLADGVGDLYGATLLGGASNDGTVFEINRSTGALQTLATFTGGDGTGPAGGLVEDGAGDIYGVANSGGASNDGTVFEINKSTGALQTLATFNGGNGANPTGGLVADSAGNLYGATVLGGASNDGTVFEIDKSTGALRTLVSFTGDNGSHPNAGLIADSAGNLYGTTSGDYPSGGTIFEIVKSTGALVTLHDFGLTGGGTQSAVIPEGLVLDSAGDLFGATFNGGAGYGSVFELASSTGALTTLHSFVTADGTGPIGRLVLDGAGNLFGATNEGGSNDLGTIFELAKATLTITGALGSQHTGARTPAHPFATVSVSDSLPASETVTVTLTSYNGHVAGALSGGGFTATATPGVYTTTAPSAAAAQADLRAAVFTPANPLTSADAEFAVTVNDGASLASNYGTSIFIDAYQSVVTGVASAQPDTAGVPINPFPQVVVTDPDTNLTATVSTARPDNGTLSGGGFVQSAPGVYTVSGAADQLTADLQALTFTPVAGQTTATIFNVYVGTSASNYGTSTIVLATAAATTNTSPAIGGTQAGQAATAGGAVHPFSSVTVADPDAGQSETATVSFAAGAGTLAGGGFVQTATPGVYTVTEPGGAAGAAAAAVQADLHAAVFTPTAGQSATTTLTIGVSDGQVAATDSTTSVVATYTAPTGGGGEGDSGGDDGGGGGDAGGGAASAPAVDPLPAEFQNLSRALLNGADALTPGTAVYAQVQAFQALDSQYLHGQLSLAQAEAALGHLMDGTTAVAVADYAFFTGATPAAQGLNYLVHSPANATDLNDAYYAQFSTENRYINFAVNLATGQGAGAAAFHAAYGSLSLSDAVTQAYLAVFGATADPTKVSAILNGLVPDGLGGQETRAAYFASYGGDGPNGQGTKAAAIGFLLAQAVETGSGVYGAATETYLAALAHGTAPATGSELSLHYGAAVSLVGVTPLADPAVTG